MPENTIHKIEIPNATGDIVEYSVVDLVAKQIIPIFGEISPTESTEGSLGQRYINTVNSEEWTCVSIEGSKYEWKQHLGGETYIKLESIRIKTPPTRTTFYAGEVFKPDGMEVVGTYEKDGEVIATDVPITGWTYSHEPLIMGQTYITILYEEAGIAAQDSQIIVVEPPHLPAPYWENEDELEYDGTEKFPVFKNYIEDLMTISGLVSDINSNYQETKTAIFTLKDTTEYQWADGTTAPKEVTWYIKQCPSQISCSTASFELNDDDMPEITLSCVVNPMSGVIEAAESSGTSLLNISVTQANKKVQVSHKGVGGSGSLTITCVQSANYSLSSISIPFVVDLLPSWYGVDIDVTTGAISRTGKAQFFMDPVPQSIQEESPFSEITSGYSPFDDISPWKDMVVRNDIVWNYRTSPPQSDGDYVVIPKYYYNISKDSSDSNILSIKVSNKPLDGFFVSPAHNSYSADEIYVKTTPMVGKFVSTNQNALLAATQQERYSKNNSRLHMMDYMTLVTVNILFLVEFAAYRITDLLEPSSVAPFSGFPTGGLDLDPCPEITYHTGINGVYPGYTMYRPFGNFKYRNIQGFYTSEFKTYIQSVFCPSEAYTTYLSETPGIRILNDRTKYTSDYNWLGESPVHSVEAVGKNGKVNGIDIMSDFGFPVPFPSAGTSGWTNLYREQDCQRGAGYYDYLMGISSGYTVDRPASDYYTGVCKKPGILALYVIDELQSEKINTRVCAIP